MAVCPAEADFPDQLGTLLQAHLSDDEPPAAEHARPRWPGSPREFPKARRAFGCRLPGAPPMIAAAGVLGVLAVFGGFAARGASRRGQADLRMALSADEVDKLSATLCGPVDEDQDYVFSSNWFDHIDNVASQDDCCSLCQKQERCDAWTWVKDAHLPTGNPGQCWLKAGVLKGKAGKLGVVSGLKRASEMRLEAVANALNSKAHEAESDGPLTGFRKRHKEPEEDDECASLGSSCLVKKCCKDAGHQCFTKNDYWAQCLTSCREGPNPLDQVSPMPWACAKLGGLAEGKPTKCADEGEDCTKSRCCVIGGTQCFEKNGTFARCKASCEPGADMAAEDWKPWTCTELGARTMGAAPWVKTKCPGAGADCSHTKCCATPGFQCYQQSQYWGECKRSCTPGEATYPGGPTWDCTPVGSRTPGLAEDAVVERGVVGKWVLPHCSGAYENCVDSQCCHGVGHQCYKKTRYFAECKETCSVEPDPNDDNATWDCEALGPRSWGLALKGFPSLFCLSLYMPERYEGPLLKAHLKANAGIFACDGYEVFAALNDTLGISKDDILVKAIQIPKIVVGVSQDGTAGNAKLFMAVWDKVIAGGRFRNYDFTIKADPDAVLIPWRIRDHMKAHVGSNAYVVNCNKFPNSPNFPMMFGAVEIFSNKAMIAYAEGSWKCGTQLPWGSWGEDYYMTHCLDFLGVGRIADFGVLGDNVCTGANCKDSYTGSFHPFKDIGAWFQCWTDATVPPVIAPPPAAPATA